MPEYLDHPEFNAPVISKPNRTLLHDFTDQAIEDYRANKRDLLTWLLERGKDPFSYDGYAATTIRKTHYKLERTYRWAWKADQRYKWRFDKAVADQWLDYLWKHDDDVPQPQIAEYEKAIKQLFKYWNNTTDANIDWSYDRQLTKSYNTERDHFTAAELRQLYETSLSHDPLSRDKSSWKIPSLIGVTNDLGFRPIEIKQATVDWMYPEQELVEIPKEDSVKSSSAWTCGLSNQAAAALSRWMDERENDPAYDDTDLVWLNAHGTAYDHKSVNYLLDQLIEKADIEAPRRDLTWYSIRHGVATMWADQEGVSYAQEQLRHEEPETTMNYTHSDSERQSDVADGKW